MNAPDRFARDKRDQDRFSSIYPAWDAWAFDDAATSELDVAHACKALVMMNRALRMAALEPTVREKMERARAQVRRRLASGYLAQSHPHFVESRGRAA